MKTVQDISKITVKVTDSDLIEGKWLNYQVLSKKLAEIEKNENMGYKSLRNRLYNSISCKKYNMEDKAGMKCINVDSPMKATASLELTFVRG